MNPRGSLLEQTFVKLFASVEGIGTAAETGAQTAAAGFVGVVEETDILAFRTLRRAGWKAVNSSADHSREKFAVVGAITQKKLAVERIAIAQGIPAGFERSWVHGHNSMVDPSGTVVLLIRPFKPTSGLFDLQVNDGL